MTDLSQKSKTRYCHLIIGHVGPHEYADGINDETLRCGADEYQCPDCGRSGYHYCQTWKMMRGY